MICLLLLVRGLIWGAPSPAWNDPSRLIHSGASPVQLTGRVLADARQWDEACSALLDVAWIDGHRRQGRTELLLRPCPQVPLQGWRVRVQGRLEHPPQGPHVLVPGAAERLAGRGSWSRVIASGFELLAQPSTPIADLRRTVARRLQAAAGAERGGLLAALVLGSAQVQLPVELRQTFRVAGLSHALAASGFHLSVLLGAAMALGRRWPAPLRLGLSVLAMLIFVVLAGAQPSVVRAVLMGGMALLIRESGDRAHGFGVLLMALSLMLLVHPSWARSIGFQLSAAATAGLILTSPGLEQGLTAVLPDRAAFLAPSLAVPLAAMAWTLPLQLLHFGSTPVYALLSNLISAPLLAPLTLSAMALALSSLLLPSALLQLFSWPVAQLAGVLIALVRWISHWPGARLLTGHPQPWVVALLMLGLLPWLLPGQGRHRRLALLPMLAAVLVQGVVQLGDGLVAIEQRGRHWLLARHRGRAALISTASDAHSCRTAMRLSQAHGHERLDWLLMLDPVATDAMACWQALGRWVQAPHEGQIPLQRGQRLVSDGLELELLSARGPLMQLSIGPQRWRLLPRPQALWALQRSGVRPQPGPVLRHWLGFRPSAAQQAWLQSGGVRVGH